MSRYLLLPKMNPHYHHHPDDVITRLIYWGNQQASVRAMLMTSTRAIPKASVDDLSDYDVILVVDDIRPFHEVYHQAGNWLEDFGEVLVVYWDPIYPDPDFGIDKSANVTQYADGIKIDFTLWPVELLLRIVEAPALPAELDAGYRVLLDKDKLTGEMRQPTYSAYIPTPPTNEIYQKWIHDFFSDAPYVAKCLLRNDLFPAKWCLDYDMKHIYLRRMLEWHMEIEHNWSVPANYIGKGLKKYLSAEIWSRLESCYAGPKAPDNWEALSHTMALFRQVATEVGQKLGYTYPLELDERVVAFVKSMQKQSIKPALSIRNSEG